MKLNEFLNRDLKITYHIPKLKMVDLNKKVLKSNSQKNVNFWVKFI